MVPAKSLAMAYGYLVYGQGGQATNLATARCLQHPCAAVTAIIQIPVQECVGCIPFHYTCRLDVQSVSLSIIASSVDMQGVSLTRTTSR
jgi:hypothetical protein